MTTTEKYAGWKFRFGILSGNMPGGCDVAATVAKLEQELAEAFPGATIDIPVQNAEGSMPNSLKAQCYSMDDEEMPQTGEYPGPEYNRMISVWESLELVYEE